MTETGSGTITDDWMVREYSRVKRVDKIGSGRKLLPVSSAVVLENYRTELKRIQRGLASGRIFVTGAKRARVLNRQERLEIELIPRLEKILGIKN